MKRTMIATAAMIALVFVASFFPRVNAQLGDPTLTSFVYGPYKVERLSFGGSCVLIVTQPGQGNNFSAASC